MGVMAHLCTTHVVSTEEPHLRMSNNSGLLTNGVTTLSYLAWVLYKGQYSYTEISLHLPVANLQMPSRSMARLPNSLLQQTHLRMPPRSTLRSLQKLISCRGPEDSPVMSGAENIVIIMLHPHESRATRHANASVPHNVHA